MNNPKTLFDKVWENHIVGDLDSGQNIIYIDRHLVHEVTSPQAFEGLRIHNRKVRRPDLTLGVADHNVPTTSRNLGIESIKDKIARIQVETLEKNLAENNIEYIPLNSINQGIVHIIGPELGFTLPGTTIVCGDSHTSTHGAFGALAFGIGTSEVEHVLATQTLLQTKPKNMKIEINGTLGKNISSKDIILKIISQIGTSAGTGHVIEFMGSTIKKMSMEERMTICNMSIEAGAKAGMISPDIITLEYLKDKKFSPKNKKWDRATQEWKKLYSDENAFFNTSYNINVDKLKPMVTWGTSPEDGISINEAIPNPSDFENSEKEKSMNKSLEYMGLTPGTKMTDVSIQKVFIGSCTNGRIEDLRSASSVIKGKKVAKNLHAIVVPGSGLVKKIAEEEGIQDIFLDAGFEWRDPGCSMCLGMNPDQLENQERCASTSNRNFEGRQGRGGRTHLVSPATAAACAIAGTFVDVSEGW
ncbi:MAG: 3-isopropylmalate dehydratase large subunit [Alphaproteobacteria bacterium MarineAlpha9_Bin4]|nr:3-isopropylmalate dehydratase large subunit [Pelagibacterales bacterium]PPR27060.1 MAG: 3-isopropylmalate dehydratase large subunit [Alphaproteobacteria bacterium MarineAlpha9_Bin4]